MKFAPSGVPNTDVRYNLKAHTGVGNVHSTERTGEHVNWLNVVKTTEATNKMFNS